MARTDGIFAKLIKDRNFQNNPFILQMKYLNQIKALNHEEVLDFLKSQVDNPDFLGEVANHKESYLPLFFKHKFYRETVIKECVKTPQDLLFFFTECLNANFIPPYNYVEQLISEALPGNEIEKMVMELITKFPSLPVTVQFMMSLINQGFTQAALTILLTKGELQKPEIIFLLLKSGQESPELIELALAHEGISQSLLAEIIEGNFKYSDNLLNKILHQVEFNEGIEASSFLKKYSDRLSAPVLHKLLNQVQADKLAQPRDTYSYRRYSHYKESLSWNPEFEKIDLEMISDFVITEVPEGSKFRSQYIRNNPEKSTDGELLELAETSSLPGVFKELLSRELTLIKKVALTKFEVLPPSELADKVSRYDNDYEKRIFFYEALPSKYRQALHKTMPLDKIPKVDTSRKKSYFFEAFQGLKKKELGVFRESLSHGYSLNQFVEDSHQSSKSTGCENLYLDEELVQELTKVEFLALAQTPINMRQRYYYGDEEIKELNFKLTVSEAAQVKEKIGVVNAFDNVDNQEQLILSPEFTEEEVIQVVENRRARIFTNPVLLKAFLTRTKSSGQAQEISSESVAEMAKYLTSQELQSLVDFKQYSGIADYINIKGTDGEYLVSYEIVKNYISGKYSIEDESLIEALSIRDPEYTKQLVEAYLQGNKGLTAFFGKSINIRRSKLDFFKKIQSQLKTSPAEIVEEIFSKGGYLEDFQNALVNYRSSLMEYHQGRTVKVKQVSHQELDSISALMGVNIVIEKLALTGYLYHLPSDELSNNIKINNLVIGDVDLDRVGGISKLIKLWQPQAVQVDPTIDPVFKLSLAEQGLAGLQVPECAVEVIQMPDLIKRLNVELLKKIEPYGLLIDEKFINEYLEQFITNQEMMQWLYDRVGHLQNYMVSQSDAVGYHHSDDEEKYVNFLAQIGVQVVPDDEYEIIKIMQKIREQGNNFEPVDVSKFSLQQKTALIKFIEEEIDPNYSKLNLVAVNLDTFDVLTSYESMKSVFSLDDQDLIRLLNIPPNLQTKKFMKAFRDLVSLGGGGFTYKVDTLKRIVPIINPEVNLELSDFINYENAQSLEESESLSVIDVNTLLQVEQNAALVKSCGIFLKGQKKSGILRFLRSASQHGENYLRDIFEMINAVINGANALSERVISLKSEGAEFNQATIAELESSINGLRERLAEVAEMDEAKHMHDRLTPLLSFIKSDPVQPLGQDKFSKLEKSKELESALGYQLFFPKTRGDLQYLGDRNGWCVNYHRSYGDNVIQKGNILVGICETGMPSSKENVIALAHYLNKGNGRYQLEQLKWSKLKKNGSTNVDATHNFKHQSILHEISSYLKEYERQKGSQG